MKQIYNNRHYQHWHEILTNQIGTKLRYKIKNKNTLATIKDGTYIPKKVELRAG